MVSSLRYLRTPEKHKLFHALQRQDTRMRRIINPENLQELSPSSHSETSSAELWSDFMSAERNESIEKLLDEEFTKLWNSL
jgi:hypothetical protein